MERTRQTHRRSLVATCLIALAIGISITVVAGTRSANASPVRPLPWGKPQPLSASQPHTEPARSVLGGHAHIAGSMSAHAYANWAGLIDTGAQFTGVSAQWVVPQVQPSSINESSATWLGIDGATNTSLIQTGTTQDSSSNGTTYFAWYEILPAPATAIGGVLPGDEMQATVDETSAGIWTISIADVTSNQGFSQAFSYSGPGASAEWIEEAPTDSSGNVAPLADFGTAEFDNLKIGGSGLSSASASYAYMTDTAGNIIAYPNSFDAATDSIQINFGSPPNNPPPTTTTTTAPPTTTTTTVPAPVSCTPASNQPAGQPTAIAAMQAGNRCPGYWIVNAGGSVYTFGNAPYLGGLNGSVASPVIDVIATPDDAGYWLVTANGTVRAFGDARSFGDMSGHQLNGQIIAMAATPDGGGYWLVGSDGGIFSFGDAQFYGSTGAMTLNKPVVGIAATPDGKGYWLVASDGGIFSFGAPFYGSLGANPPSAPIIGMAPSTDGNGYYMLGSQGNVYSFGDASYLGGTS